MTDRADILWRKMAGLFGADALERKFGPVPPPEWAGLLRTLDDFQLQRGLRRLAFSGKQHVPTLPEFLRMCREVGGDQYAETDAHFAPKTALLAPAHSKRWDREGCEHLLGYLSRQALKGIHYTSERFRTFPIPKEVDHESRALIQPLVDAKNAWSEEMRYLESKGETPKDNGRALWNECMANAEKVIGLERAS